MSSTTDTSKTPVSGEEAAAGTQTGPRPRISRGWTIVWVAFFSTAFASGGSQYGFGMFVRPLEAEFGWTRTQINISLSIGLISGLLAPFAGWVVDRYGSRVIMTVSLAIVAVSFLLRAGMTELWQWYALSALLAVGMSGTFMPVGKLVGAWFPYTRGRMMGTAITGNNVFGLIGVPLLNMVIAAQSWRLAYAIIGAGVASVAIAAWFLVRDRPGPGEGEKQRDGAGKAPRQLPDLNLTLGQAIRTPAFWFIMAGLTCAGFSYPSFMTQLIPHMEAEGWSSGRATLVLTALAGVALGSKITWGWLSERLTARVSFVIAICIMAIGIVFVILAGGTNYVWPAIIFFGLGFGGIGPLMSLVILETFGLKNFGSIQGAISLVTSIVPTLTGPIIAGHLYDTTGSYHTSFAIAAGLFATGAIAVLAVRRPKERGALGGQPS
ncbi:MAG: MFS transporter [Dehalococcoidia bacterium]|nr:MFS transporter [Dehalococcoidia bacterium]MSQ35002.1 MFS transporter [Dehalococcoidia bacterium]